jgi:hypothetical protein
MSASTHAGFSGAAADAPAVAATLGVFRSRSAREPVALFAVFAVGVGVGRIFTAIVSGNCLCTPRAAHDSFGRDHVATDSPALFPSAAFGVGHAATAHPSLFGVARPSPLHVSVVSLDAFAALGVGQWRAAIESGVPPCASFVSRAPVSFASGVGHDEQSLASVRGTDVGSANAVPPRVIPERGQVPENDVQPERSERCDVLHDDDAGS